MDRERAETFVRLLAEAALRGPDPSAGLLQAAWALTAVGALDHQTAEAILADAELALAVRHGATRPGRLGPLARIGALMDPGHIPAPVPSPPAAAAPDRYVAVGRMIAFHDETVSGEFGLMSYARTAAGARLIATWQTRDPLGRRRGAGLPPAGPFRLTDDRGNGYEMLFSITSQPESACELTLRPDPPAGIRWLDISAPGERAVRIHLEPGAGLEHGADGVPAQVSRTGLSAGEHLLNRIAERLLTVAPEFPHELRLRLAAVTPGPVTNLTSGLGAAIAALEAAEALSPLSPVPGRLAALCEALRVPGHGITAAPAPDLPEPWVSMLSHYHRRKPDSAPPGDDFAGVAAALPELDGVKLVLLGVQNYDGSTWMKALAVGQLPDRRPWAPGGDMAFPLSVWVRDSAGRWHVARPAGWHESDGEATVTLRLLPPLTRQGDRIEVLATGRSAEVRATLPLRWGN
jgi:hypothetical protein